MLVIKDLMSNCVGQLFWHGASAHFKHLSCNKIQVLFIVAAEWKFSVKDWVKYHLYVTRKEKYSLGFALWKYIIRRPSLNHIQKRSQINVVTSRLPWELLFHSMLSAWHHQSYLSNFHNSKSEAGKKMSGNSQVSHNWSAHFQLHYLDTERRGGDANGYMFPTRLKTLWELQLSTKDLLKKLLKSCISTSEPETSL